MRTIDDRDNVQVFTGASKRGGHHTARPIAYAIIALVCLVALWKLIDTLDPLARERARDALYQQQQIDSQLEGIKLFGAALLTLAVPVALAVAALGGVAVTLVLVYQRWAAPVSVAAHYQVRAIAARYQTPVPQNYAPHFAAVSRGEPLPAPAEETHAALPEPSLPGVTDLATLNYRPTKDAILLGLGEGGERITVPVNRLVHLALVGATGLGKSNAMRLIVPQLQAVGARVVLADPHYTALDPESGDDWSPIERRLLQKPAVKPGDIDSLFAWMIDELERRLELRNKGKTWGAPVFLAMDELPVIADAVPNAIDRIGRLLREGRKVGLLTVGASQSMLVKSLGGDSTIRDCYRTALYFGGDVRSGAALLDMPQRAIDDGAIGTGLALVRSVATTPAQLIRIPHASNASLYQLLGAGDSVGASRGENAGDSTVIDTAAVTNTITNNSPTPASTVTAHQDALDSRSFRVRELLRQKAGTNEILREVWSVDTQKRNGDYKTAQAELQDIIARLIG